MKTKDLVYIGIITYLAYLLLKKKSKGQETDNTTNTEGTPNNALGTTVGNGTNGGLNLGSNMDLPNLTPTSPNGLSTEVALNSSNVTPIIKDNNPTQIFGNVSLPTPYMGGSVVNPNPVDVIPTASTTPSPTASTTPSPTVTTTPSPTVTTTTQPDTSTTIPETIIDEPIKNVGIRPIKNISNIYSEEIIEQPIASTILTPVKGGSIIAEPITDVPIRPIKNTLSGIYSEEIVEQPVASTISTPTATGSSIIDEPVFPIKTIKAELITNEPNLGNPIPISQDVSEQMILECGNSFSIPNNDKEGSYTNYWFDGKEYYTQTTSPLIKTIATKISKFAYVEGCKKLQFFKLQNSNF